MHHNLIKTCFLKNSFKAFLKYWIQSLQQKSCKQSTEVQTSARTVHRMYTVNKTSRLSAEQTFSKLAQRRVHGTQEASGAVWAPDGEKHHFLFLSWHRENPPATANTSHLQPKSYQSRFSYFILCPGIWLLNPVIIMSSNVSSNYFYICWLHCYIYSSTFCKTDSELCGYVNISMKEN